MNLFQWGAEFTLASGRTSEFKIECEALGDADWETIARVLAGRIGAFGSVEGVPRGGLKLAASMAPYATVGPLVIADDVYTSGGSWEAQRAGRAALGAIAFARTRVLDPRIHVFAVVDFGEGDPEPNYSPQWLYPSHSTAPQDLTVTQASKILRSE